jgi:phage-related protein
MKTTSTIEKYELKISSAMKEIQEIEMMIQVKDGIKRFAEKNPEKIGEAVAKLREARKILNDAIGLLLDSGNPKNNL